MKTFSRKPGKERAVFVHCPVCGSCKARSYASTEDFCFVRCSACGLIYQNPQPLLEDLSRRYDSEYFDYEQQNEEAFYNLMRLGLKDICFDEYTAHFPQPRTFLDVGCATGRLIHALSDEGWKTEGVELCRASAEFGRTERGLAIHIGTLEGARFPSGAFQAVHASHLIEHLTDPVSFIREVWRILVPGGYTVLVTPNAEGFQARLFRGEWRSAISDHMCLFSMKTLKQLLLREGFTILRTGTWGGLAAGTAPVPVKKLFDRAAKRFGFGDVMIILAQKDDHAAGIDRKI